MGDKATRGINYFAHRGSAYTVVPSIREANAERHPADSLQAARAGTGIRAVPPAFHAPRVKPSTRRAAGQGSAPSSRVRCRSGRRDGRHRLPGHDTLADTHVGIDFLRLVPVFAGQRPAHDLKHHRTFCRPRSETRVWFATGHAAAGHDGRPGVCIGTLHALLGRSSCGVHGQLRAGSRGWSGWPHALLSRLLVR